MSCKVKHIFFISIRKLRTVSTVARSHVCVCVCMCVCVRARACACPPRPLLPTKRRSLKRATWFFITAEAFLSSAE